MDYGPHPIDYTRAPYQRCLSLPGVVIRMIWNTFACYMPCYKHTAAVYILQLPPVTIPIFRRVCIMNYGPHLIEYVCGPCQRCLSLTRVVIAMIGNIVICNTPSHKHTAAVYILQLGTPGDRTWFSGRVAWIMVHTLMSIDASRDRGVCLYPIWS